MASTIRTDKIGPVSGSADFTLPTSDGSAKSALITDGSKVLSFATGTPSASNFLRGDGTWAAAGGDNTPSFGAYLLADQAFSNDTWTKITFNTELWDTDSAFDHSTNYRFTVPDGESGKYFFSATTNYHDSGTVNNIGTGHMALYKNGSNLQNHLQLVSSRWNYMGATVTTVIELSDNGASANDYVEFYGYVNTNSIAPNSLGGQLYTFCSGFKLL